MKVFKLIIPLIFVASVLFGQTTAWSSSPTVTTQTRMVSGSPQIRWLWGSNLLSLMDSLNAKLSFKDTLAGGKIATKYYVTSHIGTGVASVSGTTNRITSTGGLNPIIDISSTFEGLLGKVANPLSQFASTLSSQLAGTISDETGTGSLVFSNSPTLVTPNIGTATGNITGNAATVTTNANLTGPVTSVGNATSITATGVTPGSYTNANITIGADGRATAASNGSAGSSALTPTSIKTANYNAVAGDMVRIDNSTANVVITLPSAPTDKSQIGAKLITFNSAFTATFVTSGIDVINKAGGATSGSLRITSQGITLQYIASDHIWLVMNDDLPLSGLDSRYKINYLGYIYNQIGWTTGTLASDWTALGGVSVAISGGNQVYSGGSSTFSQINNLNGGSALEYSKISMTYIVGTVNGTSTGIGPSMHSSNTTGGLYDAQAQYVTSTGGGTLKIYVGTSPSLTLASTSAASLTPIAGDTVNVTLERALGVLTATAYDITAKSAIISTTYTYPLTYSQSIIMPNTGNFGVVSYGGTQTLLNFSVYSKERKNDYICVVGDSKAVGYYSGSYQARYASLIGRSFDVNVCAGGNDKTADVLLHINQIIALSPKNVILSIGCNDIRQSISFATYSANYISIVNQLTAAGINVYNLLPLYENSGINQTPLKNFIISTYPTTYIDTKLETYAGTVSNILVADNIHLNANGHQIIANAIVASGFFTNATMSPIGSPTIDDVLGFGNTTTKTPVFGGINVNGTALFTGPLTVTTSMNSDLIANVQNTSTGTIATSAFNVGYDSGHFGTLNYTSSGYTSVGVITSNTLNLYNSVGNTNFINAGNTLFNFNIGGTAATNTRMSLSSSGLTNNFANTGGANLTMTNSVSTYASILSLINNGGNVGNFFKGGSSYTPGGIIGVNDLALFNGTLGNVDIVNGNTTGTIKFAAGNSSTSNLTINANGTSTFGSTINAVAGTTSLSSLNVPTGVAKTTPLEGDIWKDASHLYAYVNGAIRQLDQQALRTMVVSAAGTLTLALATDYAFSGTTAVYTLPAITANAGGLYQITIKNRGTGTITVNSAAGGNDIYDTAAVNTIAILPGAAVTLMPDATYFNRE